MKAKDKMERDRFLAGPACPQILKLSKRLAGSLNLFPGEPCKCECKACGKRITVFQVNYRAVLRFDTAKPCDETESEPLLQAGTELWLAGKLTLREDSCREDDKRVLVGRNQGAYQIHRYRPNEDVMRGPFCGTEGLLPTKKAAERCCAPGEGLGSFCGDGIGRLTEWSLCASYHSFIMHLKPEILCVASTLEVVMDVDGVLIGPCTRIEQRRTS